jgi:hypothetical protein
MALLDRVRERVETDLSDGELQAMIDAAAAEIEARHGPVAGITVHLGDDRDLAGHRRFLHPARPVDAAKAVTVVEIEPADTGDAANETQLAADDFRLLHGGRVIERLIDGTNGRLYWAPLVRLAYTPVSDQKQRDEVAIKLVQLDLTYRGLDKSERAGDWQRAGSVTADAFTDERDALLASLAPRRNMVMA